MHTVKWGILGCGDVTEQKSGPAFNLAQNSELVAVMRRDADKAKDYAKRHNVPKWYSNADDLINDTDVNAIYVATPPNAHAELAIKALKAGKPVYVEKPMARTYAECQEMVNASEKYKTPLYIAYYRRTLPLFLKVKELIENNEIGTPRNVNIQLFKAPNSEEMNDSFGWRVNPEISGGGHFYDLASHQLDYFDFLFGPIKQVKGLAANLGAKYKGEDTVSASFIFENGVVGTGSWSFASSELSNCDQMKITGDRGQISFSCFNFEPIVLENISGKQIFEFDQPKHIQFFLIQEIVDELLGKGQASSTGVSAMRTNFIMEEIVNDYYNYLNTKN